MKFRVKQSSHSDVRWVEASSQEIDGETPGLVKRNNGKYYRMQKRTYEKGDIIETDRDLVAEFGRKFEKISDTVSVMDNPWEDLPSKSVKQLRALAEFEEIDLEGKTAKKDILEILELIALPQDTAAN